MVFASGFVSLRDDDSLCEMSDLDIARSYQVIGAVIGIVQSGVRE